MEILPLGSFEPLVEPALETVHHLCENLLRNSSKVALFRKSIKSNIISIDSIYKKYLANVTRHLGDG